jgi:hypothetical protein
MEQHAAFKPGLKLLKEYAMASAESYDGVVLRKIVADSAPALQKHLSEEIDTLLSLQKFDSKNLLHIYKTAEGKAADQVKVGTSLTPTSPSLQYTITNPFHPYSSRTKPSPSFWVSVIKPTKAVSTAGHLCRGSRRG